MIVFSNCSTYKLKNYERKVKKQEEEYGISWEKDFIFEGKQVKFARIGEDCKNVLILVKDDVKPIETMYSVHRKLYFKEIHSTKPYQGLPPSYPQIHAVTDTSNGTFFFDKEIYWRNRHFIPVKSYEKILLKQAIDEAGCQEQFEVDYDKIIGWVN